MKANKMQALLTKVSLPKGLIGIASLLLLITNGMVFFLYVAPATSQYDQIENQYSIKKNQLETLMRIEEPDKVTHATIDKLVAQIPTNTDLSNVILSLNTLATNKALMMTSYKMQQTDSESSDDSQLDQSSEENKEIFHHDSIEIEAIGYLESTLIFIQDLYSLERVIELDSWNYSTLAKENAVYEDFLTKHAIPVKDEPIYQFSFAVKIFSIPTYKDIFNFEKMPFSSYDDAMKRLNKNYPSVHSSAH